METKAPWWLEYRRQQYKPRQTMSMEMILRRSFNQILREYANNCSVAGVRQICDTNTGWKQRCVWALVLCSMISMLCYFLVYIWCGTLANPLILMPNYSTYSIANIDYPAVAICNVNRISLKGLKYVASVLFKNKALGNVSLETVEYFLLNMGRLLDFSYIETWGDTPFMNIEAFTNRHNFDSRRVIDAMNELAPKCNEMLLKCTWQGIPVDCVSIFTTRLTARGHCCAFNYILDYDEAGFPNRSLKAKRQTLPGFMQGLNVLLDPMLYDYAYPPTLVQGFNVLLFDPTHFADPTAGRVVHRLAEPNRVEFLELKAVQQTASAEVRKYPQSTRKCLFQDEKREEYHDLYSYSACIIRCRILSVLSLCQCTPYFLPTGRQDGPICLLSDLKCLNKYKDKLSHLHPAELEDSELLEFQDSLHCPDCLPDCEHTRHITKSSKTSTNVYALNKYYEYGFSKGINMTDKCVLSIYYVTPSGDMALLDVVSYWYQVVSNIGGFGGVLLGFSVFSAVEIVYYFILRFAQVTYKNYIDYY